MESKVIDYIEKSILGVILLATVFAVGEEIVRMISNITVELSDLLLLFIYAEVVGMAGIFYTSKKIPVTLPIIIATTALSRMVILQSKELDPSAIMFETGGILLLSLSAVILHYKKIGD